ncbi:MAG: hypothetical protein WCP73_08135, partial [Eubacteriales bacterium]
TASKSVLHVGETTVLKPANLNGIWQWNVFNLKLVVNPDGSATVTALKSGWTDVYYSVGWGDKWVALNVLD